VRWSVLPKSHNIAAEMTNFNVDILIVGAGPTGLGAAWRLQELVEKEVISPISWLLVDSSVESGGAASSSKDKAGFTWDVGSHVIYSRYSYFDNFLHELMKDDVYLHQRKGWVWIEGKVIPFPIQQNLHLLPRQSALDCIKEGIEISMSKLPQPSSNLSEWLQRKYGVALSNKFFLPHSTKMWGCPPEMMSTSWVDYGSGSSFSNIPSIDFNGLAESMLDQQPFEGWKKSPPFPYPKTGGAGEVWRRAISRVSSDHIKYERKLVSVKYLDQIARFSDQSEIKYKWMISSIPLPAIGSICVPTVPELDALSHLKSTSVSLIGLGFYGPTPEFLRDKYWISIADKNIPFFRLSVPSNYSPANTPHPHNSWSVLLEAGCSEYHSLDETSLVDLALKVVNQLINKPDITPISIWQSQARFGYPIPTLDRDDILEGAESILQSQKILSRGRFGSWKYECGNQDSSFMQGVEAVDRALFGTEELTYSRPDLIDKNIISRIIR